MLISSLLLIPLEGGVILYLYFSELRLKNPKKVLVQREKVIISQPISETKALKIKIFKTFINYIINPNFNWV